MKLNFLIRVARDKYSIENKTCTTCQHLSENGCNKVPGSNRYDTGFIRNCIYYRYIRTYEKINQII